MNSLNRSLPYLIVGALVLGCNAEHTTAPDALRAAFKKGDAADACRVSKDDRGKKKDGVALVCTIAVPDHLAAITSTGKSWIDEHSGTYYLADRSNAALLLVDVATHTWAGEITGFEGAGPNGVGPSSLVEGRKGELWVSDGNSMLRVVDLRSGTIIASVSTAIAACGDACDRTNEIAYDPSHKIVVVSNPSPAGIDGYLTFVSANPPYPVLGHLSLGPGTLEGQVWVPKLQRFLVPMQNPPGRGPFIAVVNPVTMESEAEHQYTCASGGGNNNLQLGPNNNLLTQLCGSPTILDVRTMEILNVISEVGTGDQDLYNPGDHRFYVFGTDRAPGGAGLQSLGVIDAKTGTWQQNVTLVRGAYMAAYMKTNEVLARVQVNAGIVANPATDDTACEVKGRGCIAVFAHVD